MSTRATYEINGKCFYIHHDGYLEGAADYFYNALLFIKDKYRSSDFEADFFRANKNAEFTTSHEDHGDTEFQYTVTGNNLEVKSRIWESKGSKRKWKSAFNGKLIDFVNTFCHEIKEDSSLKFKEIKLYTYGNPSIHNKVSIKPILDEKLELKSIWEKNGHANGANYEILVKEIEAIKSEFDI